MKTDMTVTKSAVKNLKLPLLALPFVSKGVKKDGGRYLESLGLDKKVLKDFRADAGETLMLYAPQAKIKASRVLLLGLGEGASADDFRKAGAALARQAAAVKVARAGIDASAITDWSAVSGLPVDRIAEVFAASVVNGFYRFDRLKSGKGRTKESAGGQKDTTPCISELVLRVNAGAVNDAGRGANDGLVVASCQGLARDLVNLPGNLLNALDIGRYAMESAESYGYQARVFDKSEIERLGMGGLLAVNKGSKEPPTFSVLEHDPGKKAERTILLVGKGVTFDSGGISIKPSSGMDEMKSDMAGAAAVLATVEAAARLSLPFRVIGLIPATDNMPGGAAQKPGDVITTYSGITVEVGNTDAEGRLILVDALSWGIEEYRPDTVIDLATLTGACIVALGHGVAGMFSNDDMLAASLFDAGQQSGEKVWRLPLWDEYDEMIKSGVADVHNTGGRGAGTITAAKFLQRFIDGHPQWAHLDIAGPSFAAKASPGKLQGGTGFGVSLLLDYLRSLQK
ncbi:MAG: leucyl aminopeptidase [Prosthecochloris sp.]|nr:leucyl aminopeptidase [Prosthecochloris sp.]